MKIIIPYVAIAIVTAGIFDALDRRCAEHPANWFTTTLFAATWPLAIPMMVYVVTFEPKSRWDGCAPLARPALCPSSLLKVRHDRRP